ncbi:MAG: nucleotide-binding domain containing protein [candidate division KSB1 bacterium]|nr:nucleotide-binding domain containing protein [candidate division KSB1 bacterium]
MPAGGAEFFKALLEIKGYDKVISKTGKSVKFGKNILIVCGSAYSKGKAGFKDIANKALKIIPMPDSVFTNSLGVEDSFQWWKEKVVQAFHKHTVVIIEIDQQVVRDKNYAVRLRKEMARLVHVVLKQVDVNELLIDGGATVHSITEKLGFEKLFPVQELSPGVIRMRVQSRDHFFVTIKPGSYAWPAWLLNYLGAR